MYRHGVGGYPTERPVLMHTWNTFTVHLRQRFGQRVQKIPLDAGASCPNRDGTLSRAGCTFCNAIGSGSGARPCRNEPPRPVGALARALPQVQPGLAVPRVSAVLFQYLRPRLPARGDAGGFPHPARSRRGFRGNPARLPRSRKNGYPRRRAVERKMA